VNPYLIFGYYAAVLQATVKQSLTVAKAAQSAALVGVAMLTNALDQK
jgi:hypothetical protein